MNKFVIELPFLKYDKDALLSYQYKIENWTPNQLYLQKGIDTTEIKFFDAIVDNDAKILIPILKYFNFSLPHRSCKFTKVLKNGIMPFHIDQYRNCILMIPISNDPSSIVWTNKNNNILYTHKYRCPTIINGKILHGVPETKNDRIFLQINLPIFWNQLANDLGTYFKTEIL